MKNEVSEYADYEEYDSLPANSDDYENEAEDYLGKVKSYVDTAYMIADKTQELMGLYAQCKQVEEHTKQLKVWSEVEIARTVAKYKSCQDFLDKTFGEREHALNKHYELLDKAVESNDKDLIIAALSGISSIVTKSPLDDFEEFVKLYNDDSQPLLDF